MAQYDWMKDSEFRTELTKIVSRVSAANGIAQYQKAIVDRLMGHVEERREMLVESELMKEASERRTESDAIESAEILIKEACGYAKSEGRTLLDVRDFERAYEAKFCMVWPFCGKGK